MAPSSVSPYGASTRLAGTLARLALSALLASPALGVQAGMLQGQPPAGQAASRSTGIAPSPTEIDPLAWAGIASLMVIGLLLLLYFYRRRLFILCWIAACALAAASMFLTTWHYSSVRLGFLAYGIAQFLGILSALAFVMSADAYRRPPHFGRRHAWTLLAVLIWFAM